MRTNKFFSKKKPAQAMVEFAIALPILLLLLYGILEAGRLLFLYSTVVTASRQAVRYGAATGQNDAGVFRYNDCDGIRAAANAAGYLGRFDSITIAHDQGVTNTNPPAPIDRQAYCSGPTASLDTNLLKGNRTRLVVTVTQEFRPIVPKLVPFIQRSISATSARTILYSVPIVVEQEQQEWYKKPTETLITSDEPDPSEINGTVTVTVSVKNTDGTTPAPTGVVNITGADTNCNITLNNNGTGSCDIVFTSEGHKQITAFYNGDTDHLASSDVEDHEVTLYNTVTTILSDLPDPSVKGEGFVVIVKVEGGQTTPRGNVVIDGGGNVNCTIVLLNGAGSCALTYNTLGMKTLTATYSGDSQHLPSSDTEFHEVLVATPTPSLTPTITPIPPSRTPTVLPTKTPTPTPIPTRVPSCNSITHGPITRSGNVMSMTVTNPYPFTLVLKDITVTWNDDKGHRVGDKRLRLQKVTVGNQTVFTGNVGNQSTVTIITTATMGPGTTTVSFYFNQSYDITDGTENILINFTTPGCENDPVDSSK